MDALPEAEILVAILGVVAAPAMTALMFFLNKKQRKADLAKSISETYQELVSAKDQNIARLKDDLTECERRLRKQGLV